MMTKLKKDCQLTGSYGNPNSDALKYKLKKCNTSAF